MSGRVNERTTSLYTGQLVDENNANIQLADIVTFILTLYDAITGQVLGGRDHQNVLNLNGITVGTTGAVSWILTGADNAVINPALDTELHIALFEGTYGASNKPFKHEFAFRVVNLAKVP